jgi:hypothetical protein
LIDIQGKLEILVNNKCFFIEPSLALLEFRVELARWSRKEDFYYFTMEHDEGPILAFINKGENNWSLFSIWQEFEHKGLLCINIISDAVDLFLLKLDRELIKNFGIKIADFISSY